MTNPYRIAEPPAPSSTAAPSNRLRFTLWLLLVISLAANAAASSLGATLVSIIFGSVALACAIGLVINHYRRRAG